MKTLVHFLRPLALLIALFFLTAGMQYLYAWTGAQSNPPNGNVMPPVNTSSVDQIKGGGLGVDGLAVFGESSMLGDLDMGGFEITNVASPTAETSVATKSYVDQLAATINAGAGGDSVMYLSSQSTPNDCPTGWEEADYNQVVASGWDQNNLFYNNVRTCYAPANTCQVMYLKSLMIGSAYNAAECPSGWTEADLQSMHALASPSLGQLKNAVRTCYICN